MEAFLHQVFAGLATGGIYASLALALVMIYQSTHHINFAQGEMAMFSTYISWQLMTWGLSFWLAFIVAVALSFVMGVLIERLILRPLHNAPVLSIIVVFIGLLATFGMMLAERNDPASRLGTLHEAGAWSLSTMLRLPGFRPYQPVTSDGRLLTLVVGTCALLAASFFTAQIVNWVRGAGGAESRRADESPEAAQVAQHLLALTGQVEALRATVESLTSQVQALAPPPPDPAPVAEPDATEPTPPAPDTR